MEVEFQLDSKSEEASWIASIINLGQIFGALFFGAISGLIGRRMTLVFQSIPLVLGWLLIGISDGNFVIIIFGRILGGIGLISTVSQMYLVEIADSNNRGQFGALGAVFVSVGITKVYILGALLNWRTVCLICGVQPVLYILVLLFYLPETPLYLASKDKFQKTEKVLKWLRGPKYDICTELEGLKSAEKNDNERYLDKLRKFSKPSAYNPMIVLTVLFALQQWTGSYAVIFYSVNIFKDVGISGNGLEYIPSILVGFIRIIGTIIGTILLKKLGRRTLLIISSGIAGVILCLLALTLYFMSIKNVEDKWMLLLPALEVIMYILAYGIGLGIVPWILIGELCTTELKGVISGIATCSCYLNIFITVKLFPQSILSIGSHGTFLVFAVFCLASIIFAVLKVPETKGKSMQEIQAYFNHAVHDSGECS
ncbi:facilitated trehalose transporter Tret1 isoform X2 [Lepeophtheirus salmonis]|nr:facilitated trehalose transporter Tret1-like isoform X2 [Lepeophtheirus salmonis]